jgi:D-ribose pyranase
VKKIGLLNQPLSNVIAGMGHKDMLCVADAGLPIPASTERIDLAVSEGVPSFLDVLDAILGEMQVESAIIAEEMKTTSPDMYAKVVEKLKDIPITRVSHEDFKKKTAHAHAVARTGEYTPYANVILVAGVVF